MKIDNLFNIQNKTAVVTGGSRGIGEMITASGLLANGAKVYISAQQRLRLCLKKRDEFSQRNIMLECIAHSL
ncbi:MAG: hypothetical protein ACJ0FW_03635 [Gammaproteobacteria bacterium]